MGKELLSSINLTSNDEPETPLVSLFKVFHCRITARNALQTCSAAIRWSDLDFGSIACFIYAQLGQSMYRDRKRDAELIAVCQSNIEYSRVSAHSSCEKWTNREFLTASLNTTFLSVIFIITALFHAIDNDEINGGNLNGPHLTISSASLFPYSLSSTLFRLIYK